MKDKIEKLIATYEMQLNKLQEDRDSLSNGNVLRNYIDGKYQQLRNVIYELKMLL